MVKTMMHDSGLPKSMWIHALKTAVYVKNRPKYEDRNGSAFEPKVDKWLRTFDEYHRGDDLDPSEKQDGDGTSVNVHDGEQCDHINDEDMVEKDGASSVDWNNEDQQRSLADCTSDMSAVNVPQNYREAMRSKFAKEWRPAVDKGIQARKNNGVLHVIPNAEMPVRQRAIKTMRVYSVKVDHLGYVVRFKAWIVVLCNLLLLVIYQGINTAYLNALLAIKQYLEDLEGYPNEEDGATYMINKALYGLQQSGREWNSECATEPCLYFYDQDGEVALVLLDVDDILCATRHEPFKKRLLSELNETYGIKTKIIGKFHFNDADPSGIPMETKLCLTRTQQHIGAAKRVLRYLVKTKSMGIEYLTDKNFQTTNTLVIDGFCDSDGGNDRDTRKSVAGYPEELFLGDQQQTIVAQSTAEAEYVAACEASMDVLIDAFLALKTEVRLGIDNQAAEVIATYM
ncbi:Integrase, catalytic core protein [Phytophthora megakarya]|uniref:Integrase, catalytic core protein n=1 Tax=Phytophthora megakarya TaxID=4795 RepID=A0A225WBM8_9STRA|nr:Integrase, catalytic core protein [Phytophthora megakarya]